VPVDVRWQALAAERTVADVSELTNYELRIDDGWESRRLRLTPNKFVNPSSRQFPNPSIR